MGLWICGGCELALVFLDRTYSDRSQLAIGYLDAGDICTGDLEAPCT